MKETPVVTTQLRAKHRLADGTPVLRFEVPYNFVEEEAARALAAEFADEPVRKSVATLMEGLQRAAKNRVLEDPDRSDVPDVAIDAYRAVLREQRIFPVPDERQRMLDELNEAKAESKAAADVTQAAVKKVTGRQPRIWSKHTQTDPEKPHYGEPYVRIEVPYFYSLAQAAVALAVVLADHKGRFGERTVRTALQQAAWDGVLDRPGMAAMVQADPVALIETAETEARERFDGPDEIAGYVEQAMKKHPASPALMDKYRQTLIEMDVFPAPGR